MLQMSQRLCTRLCAHVFMCLCVLTCARMCVHVCAWSYMRANACACVCEKNCSMTFHCGTLLFPNPSASQATALFEFQCFGKDCLVQPKVTSKFVNEDQDWSCQNVHSKNREVSWDVTGQVPSGHSMCAGVSWSWSVQFAWWSGTC